MEACKANAIPFHGVCEKWYIDCYGTPWDGCSPEALGDWRRLNNICNGELWGFRGSLKLIGKCEPNLFQNTITFKGMSMCKSDYQSCEVLEVCVDKPRMTYEAGYTLTFTRTFPELLGELADACKGFRGWWACHNASDLCEVNNYRCSRCVSI